MVRDFLVRLAFTLSVLSAPVAGKDWTVIHSFPHDETAFTQGLSYRAPYLFETTGQRDASRLIRYELEQDSSTQLARLPRRYFGEGSVVVGDRALWLTWRNRTAFWIDLATGEREDAFYYPTEGWGLAINDTNDLLVMSDGSNTLRFLDMSGTELRQIRVNGMMRKWDQLNELEWVGDTIFANRWHTNQILAIDANTGGIKKIYQLDDLVKQQDSIQGLSAEMTFNGIAYLPESDSFIVTGKYWNRFYQISLEGWR